MSTIVYRNAKILVDGVEISADLYEMGVEYSAEMLDETCFGDDTRVHKGGLKMARISGAGCAQFGATDTFATLLFDEIGTEEAVVAVFADGITEGDLYSGFAMKGVMSEFKLGEAVGQLLKLTFAFEGRGIEV